MIDTTQPRSGNTDTELVEMAHTLPLGSAAFNEHLSQRRAEAVFEALVYANKVPENRVQLHWTSERLPVTSAADEEAESHNRMAVIIVSDAMSARCGG